MNSLNVGAAKICITPKPEMLPFPNKFGGPGYPDYYTDIYSDCYVRACVLGNGKKTAAIVGFDLIGLSQPENIKANIEKETGIPVGQILLAATHNHTACDLYRPSDADSAEDVKKGSDYQQMVLDAAVKAVKQAKSNMRPSRYGYGEGLSYINSNRDMRLEDGTYTQGPEMGAYSDKTLSIMKFVDEENRLICAVANYGMHATMAFLDVDTDGQMKVSGNIPGTACEYAEARYGNGAVVIWTSAAAGDQNPIAFCMRDYDTDGFPVKAETLPGMQYQLLTLFGKQHGVDICKTIDSIKEYSGNMPVRFVEMWLDLPGQKPPKGADMGKNNRYANRRVRIPEGESLIEMTDSPEHPVSLYIQQAVFGDIAFIGAAAELYGLLGKACKEVSPYRKTIVLTHIGKSVGYIVDHASVDHRCFQAFGAVKPGAGDEIIVNGVRELFDQLMAEQETEMCGNEDE